MFALPEEVNDGVVLNCRTHYHPEWYVASRSPTETRSPSGSGFLLEACDRAGRNGLRRVRSGCPAHRASAVAQPQWTCIVCVRVGGQHPGPWRGIGACGGSGGGGGRHSPTRRLTGRAAGRVSRGGSRRTAGG